MVGIKEAVQVEQIPLEIALRAITSNPAKILKLAQKAGSLLEWMPIFAC